MTEERIYAVAYAIHQKYVDKDLAHDAHEIWLLAGDCLKQLIVPFEQHPLACQLMKYMVNFYCDAWKAAHPEYAEAV